MIHGREDPGSIVAQVNPVSINSSPLPSSVIWSLGCCGSGVTLRGVVLPLGLKVAGRADAGDRWAPG